LESRPMEGDRRARCASNGNEFGKGKVEILRLLN
jgi:hypothetical protein